MVGDIASQWIGDGVENERNHDRQSSQRARQAKHLGKEEKQENVEASAFYGFSNLAHAVGELCFATQRHITHLFLLFF